MKTVKSAVAHAMDQFEFGQSLQQNLQADVVGFEKLSNHLRLVAGINLPTNDKNLSLMAGRVGPILRDRGLKSYSEYYRFLIENSDQETKSEFVSALTTNTTEFFRENKHYEILKSVLPSLTQGKQGAHELRVWCAASSTGQEPYTILMTLLENLQNSAFWDMKFLATDIDLEVLQRAADGIYSEAEMRNVPQNLRQKYFSQVVRRGERAYQVQETYRNKIRYAQLNLLSVPFPFQHKFDVIFCRNVLIYFERETAQAVVERMAKSLRPGGYLFLGHSETGAGRTPLLTAIAPAVYQRVTGV